MCGRTKGSLGKKTIAKLEAKKESQSKEITEITKEQALETIREELPVNS